MTSDRERYDIDWSSLTPAEAALVDEFATALRQAREEETEQLLFNLREIFRKDTDALNAELRAGRLSSHKSPSAEFWSVLNRPIVATMPNFCSQGQIRLNASFGYRPSGRISFSRK
jgi:hypothetical protein